MLLACVMAGAVGRGFGRDNHEVPSNRRKSRSCFDPAPIPKKIDPPHSREEVQRAIDRGHRVSAEEAKQRWFLGFAASDQGTQYLRPGAGGSSCLSSTR